MKKLKEIIELYAPESPNKNELHKEITRWAKQKYVNSRQKIAAETLFKKDIQLSIDKIKLDKFTDSLNNNIYKDLVKTLKIVQRSYNGNYNNGYTIRITGEEMKTIEKLTNKYANT